MKVSGFRWYLQDFDTKKQTRGGKTIAAAQSPSLGNLRTISIVERLTDASKGNEKTKISEGIMEVTLGIKDGKEDFSDRNDMADRIDLFNALTLLRDQLKISGSLETEIEAALIEAGT